MYNIDIHQPDSRLRFERRYHADDFNPYISFKNNAREAMEFYQTVFGGKSQHAHFQGVSCLNDPSEDDLIMHATLETENGLTLMGADTLSRMEYRPGTNLAYP